MKYAIVQKPHGRPGAILVSIEEAEKDIETVAKLFKTTTDEVKEVFKKSGYNVFNPVWLEFVYAVHKRNEVKK